MVVKNSKHPVVREFAALAHWLERHRRNCHRVDGEWGDHFPIGGDQPLSPTPRVDLYRDREKLVIPPGRTN